MQIQSKLSYTPTHRNQSISHQSPPTFSGVFTEQPALPDEHTASFTYQGDTYWVTDDAQGSHKTAIDTDRTEAQDAIAESRDWEVPYSQRTAALYKRLSALAKPWPVSSQS